jgi:hypothetical protein
MFYVIGASRMAFETTCRNRAKGLPTRNIELAVSYDQTSLSMPMPALTSASFGRILIEEAVTPGGNYVD